MKANNPGSAKIAKNNIFGLLMTSNDRQWIEMTPDGLKTKTKSFMHIKWKLITQAVQKPVYLAS